MKNFKEIPGSLHYAVSPEGKVARLPYERMHNINKHIYKSKFKLLTPNSNNSKGYLRIAIYYNDGTKVVESVHRLVAKLFIPNPENKPQVNHIDGNKLNNHFSNLEWVTNKENQFHAVTQLPKRNHRKGTTLHANKLTEEQVISLPNLLKNRTVRDIAKEWNVAKSTLSEIIAGRSWRHLNVFPAKPRKCEKYFNESRYVPTTTET